jgi:gamma-glutamyltranspeptidase / glutathione hydrolase
MAHSKTHDTPTVPAAEAAESNVVMAFVAALAVASLGIFASAQGNSAAHSTPHAVAQDASGQVATGSRFAVATAAPEASEAALKVLQEGGNAYDALVAASFVVSVVRPQSTGIGGGGFVLHYDAETKKLGALDGRETAPAAATPDMYQGDGAAGYRSGPLSAGTPGLVAMLWQLHQDHGSDTYAAKHGGKAQAWKHLLQPAIGYAKEGCKVSPTLARAINRKTKLLRRYPSSAKVFLPGGEAPKAGQTLRQEALGQTLEIIATRGAAGFYDGRVAQALVQSSRDAGGNLTRSDLRDYRPKVRDAIEGRYRGQRVASFPPPSSGGVILVEMLNMLSHYEFAHLEHNSADHIHLLAEVMRRAYADRNQYLADPDSLSAEQRQQLATLTDPAYAKRLATQIDPARATPSRLVSGGLQGGDHTTHISILDSEGNAVASTQTINTHMGSGFVAGESGVLLNNEMNDFTAEAGVPNAFGAIQSTLNLPGPGKRPLSSMSPTIVFDAEGKAQIVVGAAGGTKIITTVLQIVSNLVDFKKSPKDAMGAPRMHHQHLPDQIYLEEKLRSVSRDLTAKGHRVHFAKRAICEAQLVVRDGATLVGVADPRGDGQPAAE